MKNILVPVDGSEASLRALQTAINMMQLQNTSGIVHVLNVQTPMVSNNAARFFSAEVLQNFYQDEGAESLTAAQDLLIKSGLAYKAEVRVGRVADVVQAYVTENNCDHIVMGTRGLGAVPGLLLGSAATKILHITHVPVTLIK